MDVAVEGLKVYVDNVMAIGVPSRILEKLPVFPPADVTLLNETTAVAEPKWVELNVAVPCRLRRPVICVACAWGVNVAAATAATRANIVFDNFMFVSLINLNCPFVSNRHAT